MDLKQHAQAIFWVLDRLKGREESRALDVAEDRDEMAALVETLALNKAALAFVRKLDRMDAAKRDDVLRSLDPLLEVFHARWEGISTPDMLDGSNVVPLGSSAA